MRFQHITAPLGSRSAEALPVTHSQPDRFSLIEVVRKASTALGLKAPIIATLDALLSCLPPKRSHNFVFASNATIAFKRNGISDRTIRRHVAQLADPIALTANASPRVTCPLAVSFASVLTFLRYSKTMTRFVRWQKTAPNKPVTFPS